MKGLKLWQKFVLFAVVIGVAGGSYGIYHWVNKPSTSSQSTDIQLVQVQYGNITNSVSASGSLVFPVREKLTFGSAGTVAEVAVAEGDTVAKGQLLAKFDDASLLPLQEAVVQARIKLSNALDTTQAEIAVTTAKIALVTAQKNLENAETPYSESDILQAEIAVTNAKIALKKAQDNFDKAKEKYDSNPTVPDWILDYELKKAQLPLAEYTLAEAEETLAEIKAGADPLQVELKRKELEVAQANLNKAEAELAGIQGTVTSLEGELKQLQIAAAQTALNSATSRLEAAIVLAPFDGIATSVNVAAGQAVSASTVVLEIVDQSVIEVSAVLDEIDVPQVKPGQRVIVSLSSLSDMELSGEVSAISSTSKTQSGVVTYTVTIRVTPPSGVQVREGMSATADIVVEEANNVLLIPTQAITGTTNNPAVQVMVNGVIQQRVVTLGLSDGSYSEVLSGLQSGEQVILPKTTSTGTTTQQSTRGTIFPTDGMPGGGGGFIPR
ncbi:MAG: efflux RND transporter periplasmic adaptor subunit [Dehalococcoidales bacterium]|nr:efflux RND transporter periplasmic adaptor subunit [Dehalococcoidales bacterium]